MTSPNKPTADFSGVRVVSFESRRTEEIGKLIRRLGGQALLAPSMREVPLEDHQEVFGFGKRLFEGTLDMVILMTGVGTRTLVKALETKHPQPAIVEALAKTILVVRGPKPIVALAELKLKPTITVPEPNTWEDILRTLDAERPVAGLRVAVQEYGNPNPELLEGLRARGAQVLAVPVYRWALPEDTTPLKEAVQSICKQDAEVLLFTSAQQITHTLEIARSMELERAFVEAARQCMIASIGPICSAALQEVGLPVDFEPQHPRMGSLVTEASRQSQAILQAKRRQG